ncbi:MAG: nucleotidyltransferase substrate binding protein [Gammaproteobacteria bacterium]|nr:nucleotidyltransferase substrate binding protein [Gammaproteobacteria bacterium]MDA7971273.1 nucleotidyltransferase substrate binding protein [Gammaproteobacteria bacterium]MDA7994720.1 nucleotidyltransferase substrate binding protein [Gammaproteobacteria bacterium]MDA8023637.1 nucleotidyltransferase substrate binding protein [Gammaproteobacteria bacterium]CAJ2376176.1 MAG: Nucleotidyltransferase [Arenicellales bacterium IbO2]
MTERQDIRWKQRFANYKKALKRLARGVEIATERELTELEGEGLIQVFEFTYEMAWKSIKDFYENQGDAGMQGSKDAMNKAINRGLVANGAVWMDMYDSRNDTSHSYDEEKMIEVTEKIIGVYLAEFERLRDALEERA